MFRDEDMLLLGASSTPWQVISYTVYTVDCYLNNVEWAHYDKEGFFMIEKPIPPASLALIGVEIHLSRATV